MSVRKPHMEFHPLNLDEGWKTPPGYSESIQQKILASDLDEVQKVGSRTRLLRFQPGAFTTEPFVHDHWEGDMSVGRTDRNRQDFTAQTYACRPPGVPHGPFKSEHGSMLFRVHFYDPRDKGEKK